MSARVLVVEDDSSLAAVIGLTLRDAGHEVEHLANGRTAVERLARGGPDLVLLDISLPGRSGLEILRELKGVPERPAAVMMTAYGTIESAVEAMKLGAAEYLVKPFAMEELANIVERVLEVRRLRAENDALRRSLEESALGQLVGDSPRIRETADTLRRAARSDATVLLQGETGTGKGLAARALHAMSRRAAGPFVAVNCAAVPEGLVESELFGHVKGAFTGAVADRTGKFEHASGGTLFFDEVADLPPASQSKLLRCLQEREVERVGQARPVRVDVRVVAATNRDLRAEMGAGRFREDLFYRLAVIEVALPPLRDRLEDLPALAEHTLRRLGRPDVRVSSAALGALRSHAWPGNVRELEHVLERALVFLGTGKQITPEHLPAQVRSPLPRTASAFRLPAEGVVLEEVERSLVEQALERTRGNRTQASELLGLTRSALLYRVEKYNLSRLRPRARGGDSAPPPTAAAPE